MTTVLTYIHICMLTNLLGLKCMLLSKLKKNARHEGRFCSRPKLLHSLSSTKAVTSSIIPMEDHHYSEIVNGIPIFSGTLHQNIPERMNIVSLKFDTIGYDSR